MLDQHQQQRSVQEGTGYYQESKDFDFHFRIVKGSRNARLIQMLCEDLYYLLRVYRYKSSTKPGRAKQALKEHKDVVAALMRRDPEEAERKMRLHISNARRYVEEQMREAASRREAEPPAAPKPKLRHRPTAPKKVAVQRAGSNRRRAFSRPVRLLRHSLGRDRCDDR